MKKILNFLSNWASAHSDKVPHAFACLLLVLYLSALLPVGGAIFITAVIAFAKEWHDGNREGNQFDWYDIAADVAGIVLAAVPVIIMT